MDRRKFIKDLTALGVAAGVTRLSGVVPQTWAGPEKGQIPYRQLGSTGEKVSRIGLGGFHLGRPDEPESIRIIRSAIDRGINFMDNSWEYNGGVSEIRMGKALRDGYRQKVFLMTKIDGRTAKAATEQLDESLKRLQTDSIDLLQFHELIACLTRSASLPPRGPMRPWLKLKRLENFATSASPVTKAPPST